MNLSGRTAGGKFSALASLQSHLLSDNLTQRLSNSALICPRQQVSIRCFAQPRKKLPERSVQVCCTRCRTLLYKYKKGGKGSLVKCYLERITEDNTAGDLRCPKCKTQFAREALIHGRPAHKIIGGKVFQK